MPTFMYLDLVNIYSVILQLFDNKLFKINFTVFFNHWKHDHPWSNLEIYNPSC